MSSKARDPCLTEGRGYFVENEAFEAHLDANKEYRQPVRPSILIDLHSAYRTRLVNVYHTML